MGGSNSIMQHLGGMIQPPQYQDQQFNNQQVLDYARNNYNADTAKQYKQAVIDTLRNGGQVDPNQIWGQVMNSRNRSAFNEQQQQQQQLEQQQSYTSDFNPG